MADSTENGLWSDPSYWSEPAEIEFAKARRMARREALVDRILKRRSTLLAFDDVSSTRVPESLEHSRTVPIAQIVGSVGKDDLFSRTFLPRSNSLLTRWKKVYALVQGLRGYEPVELYETNGQYYVVDGHFRVSVARTLGHDVIEARVRRWS